MNKKVLVPIALIIAIIAIGSIFSASPSVSSAGQYAGSVGYVGIACHHIIRADGTVEPVKCTHNLVTTYGLEFIKNAVNGTSGNWNLINLTLGGNASAMAASDTDLAGIFSTNGLTPAAATYARIGNGNSSLTYQWTDATATSTVNSTGIYNQTLSGAHLFSEAYFGSNTVLNVGDKINVTYYWWIA